jgi:hypothetical protein
MPMNYLRRSNQKDEEGNKLVANTTSNGRFHSDWCSMMYSRLRLARNILDENGLIFISLDDGEIANLRKICDEIFGEDKLIASFIWKSRQNKDNRSKNGASVDHEYVLAYGKSIRGADRDLTGYSNPDGDPRGDWASANMVGLATADRRPNLHYDLINPATGINYGCPLRVLKVDTSNMADVFYAPDALDKPNLDLFVDNIKPDRTPEDLLFQVMLDWGVDLALPIAKQTIQGKDVFLVDGNALAACFDGHGGVDEDFVKELAKVQPLRVVFRDAGFKDSSVKINVEQIFKLLSPATEVKCI